MNRYIESIPFFWFLQKEKLDVYAIKLLNPIEDLDINTWLIAAYKI